MLVYRSTRHERSVSELTSELLRVLARATRHADSEALREALLRVGALECGVTDLVSPFDLRARIVARWTDSIGQAYVSGRVVPRGVSAQLIATRLPPRVQASEPEGYAYYALDPRAYARAADRADWDAGTVGVVGIRSIGTSLSAVVTACLRKRGIDAWRISVRPTGHPWARTQSLGPHLYRWIHRLSRRSAHFVVVDEGPGLSGSTFIAVAQMLEAAGIPPSRIRLMCSHPPAPDTFTSDVARSAWSRYTSLVAEAEPLATGPNVSAGEWRRRVFGTDSRAWPACWTQLERIKHLSDDGRWLDKFEGFPPYCHAGLERAGMLAEAALAPPARYVQAGMVRVPWLAERPAETADLRRGAIGHIAAYCAFRARAFRVPDADGRALSDMLQVNAREALGVELLAPQLEVECPIIADCRMQPFKWRVTREGRYLKLDGHADGDGHLLPGPCDVCWDLAGAIAEWHMNDAQANLLIEAFERQSGLGVRLRLPQYRLAYSAYRVGAMTLAALSASADEAPRIARARSQYCAMLAQELRRCELVA